MSSDLKTEEQLILEYRQAEEKYNNASDRLDIYFMSKVREALDKEDLKEAERIFHSCPDSVTKAFIMDAIRYRGKA